MTSERKIEILTNILKGEVIRNTRIMSRTDFSRELGNLAKKVGASTEEVRELIVPIVKSAVADMLAE